MKNSIATLALCFFLTAFTPTAFAINGNLTEQDGVRILQVWGTSYEMGYAQGYLFKEEVVDIMRVYTFPPPGTGTWLYEWAREFVLDNFSFTPEIIEEAQGLYDGMIDAGVDPYVDVLFRDFDADDILTYNGLADIVSLFCATLIAWGTTTADDPELQGALSVSHNTDFVYEDEDPWLIAQKSVIIVYTPSDPALQSFASIGSAGLLGVIAGMNESGLVMIVNQGLYPYSGVTLNPKPELTVWAAREALSKADYNGDRENSVEDVIEYYRGRNQFSATINQVAGPADRSDPPAVVLEMNNIEKTIRYPQDDLEVMPDSMIALNWEDKLMPDRDPDAQERYDLAVDLVNVQYDRNLTLDNQWDFLDHLQQPFENVATMQSMLFIPHRRMLAIAISSELGTAPSFEPVWIDLNELFGNDDGPIPGPTKPPFTSDDYDDDDSDLPDDDDDDATGSDSEDSENGCGCG